VLIAIGALALALAAMLVHRFYGPKLGRIDKSKSAVFGHGAGAVAIGDVMMVVVTIVVLAAALYVILSRAYDAGAQKWAFGAIGTIVGFWLKAEKATLPR
jgi:hypothetical protein